MSATAPPSVDEPTTDRRARRKAATRRALIDAAVDLFASHGFEQVTVDDIAERADVTARTFHRHFASKEAVLFADSDERLARFSAALASSPVADDVLTSVRRAYLEMLDGIDDLEADRGRIGLLESASSLRAHHLGRMQEFSEIVARFAAERTGLREDHLWPRLVGSCCTALFVAVRRGWEHDAERDVAADVDDAFAMLDRLGSPPAPDERR